MDDAVRIPLIAGPHVLFPLRVRTGAAPALVGKRRQGIQIPMLLPFQFFLYRYGCSLPFASFTGKARYS